MSQIFKPANQPNYLDTKRFTFKEYCLALKQPVSHPDRIDPNDERYYKKYAQNLPPFEAYFIIPEN